MITVVCVLILSMIQERALKEKTPRINVMFVTDLVLSKINCLMLSAAQLGLEKV